MRTMQLALAIGLSALGLQAFGAGRATIPASRSGW